MVVDHGAAIETEFMNFMRTLHDDPTKLDRKTWCHFELAYLRGQLDATEDRDKYGVVNRLYNVLLKYMKEQNYLPG